MKTIHLPILFLTCILIFGTTISQATYISEGSVILLRSQFGNSDQVNVDGVLDDGIWQKANTYPLSFAHPEPLDITIYFANTIDYMYFGIDSKDLESNANDSLLFTIDTEGNGNLTTPEDGRLVTSDGIRDLYWDGSSWKDDGFQPNNPAGESAQSRTSGRHVFEFKIPLVSSDVTYDGFRVVDLSSSIISFNLQYNDTQAVGNSSIPLSYSFPTSPTNGSGYIDLKLAGPEDQDLPDFTPQETFSTEDDTSADDVFDTVAGEVSFHLYFVILALALPVAYRYIRRVQL